jgi:hypothetical protein
MLVYGGLVMRLPIIFFIVIWLPIYAFALEQRGESAEVPPHSQLEAADTPGGERKSWEGPLTLDTLHLDPAVMKNREPAKGRAGEEGAMVGAGLGYILGGKEGAAIGAAVGVVRATSISPENRVEQPITGLVDPKHLPVVSIGQPEIWPLSQVYPLQKMPLLMQAQLKQADFYLIRLFCSFRPLPGQSRVGWARFHVFLLPNVIGQQPIAYDISPQEITQDVKRHLGLP